MRHVQLAILVAALVLGPRMGSGQTPSGEAEHLFREGKRLMNEGNVADACLAFDGSYRKDPAVTTLVNLANCHEANRQFATAWGEFVEAARLTRGQPSHAALNQTAIDRAALLEPRLSYLIINVPVDVQVEGLSITRDGEVVDVAEWNRAVPVDGGEFKIEARAPAHEPWSTVVKVGNAKDKQSVDVPKFQPGRQPPEPLRGRHSSMSPRRRLAIAMWAVGGVATGSAIALELSGRTTYDKAKAATDNQSREELYDSANRKHSFAAVSGGVAATAIGVGLWLWFTGASSDIHEPDMPASLVVPVIDQHSAQVTVRGWF